MSIPSKWIQKWIQNNITHLTVKQKGDLGHIFERGPHTPPFTPSEVLCIKTGMDSGHKNSAAIPEAARNQTRGPYSWLPGGFPERIQGFPYSYQNRSFSLQKPRLLEISEHIVEVRRRLHEHDVVSRAAHTPSDHYLVTTRVHKAENVRSPVH